MWIQLVSIRKRLRRLLSPNGSFEKSLPALKIGLKFCYSKSSSSAIEKGKVIFKKINREEDKDCIFIQSN